MLAEFKSFIFAITKDGTVESDIPSPELFPIHYLDELEFFPGDYVVDAKGKLKSLILFCLLYLLVINIHKDIFPILTFIKN